MFDVNYMLNNWITVLTNMFRYVRDRMQTGSVFGSKDLFSGLAIIADTYSNHNGPHNVSINLTLGLLTSHIAGTLNLPIVHIVGNLSIKFLQHQHPYLTAMVNNGTVSYDHDRD